MQGNDFFLPKHIYLFILNSENNYHEYINLKKFIIMTREDFLERLHRLGFKLETCEAVQEGTWVFKSDKVFSSAEMHDFEINYHFAYFHCWYQNWLTVYPEIESNVLDWFIYSLKQVCTQKGISYQQSLNFLPQRDLSPTQILIRVAFNERIPRHIREKICRHFQKKNAILCKSVSENEFLIDCSVHISPEEIERQKQEALERKNFADECGRLSRLLNISFCNVMAIGTDENLLKRHRQSMDRASGLIAAQDQEEKLQLYFQIFNGNKETKEKAIKSLGIEIGNTDIMKIDFFELKDAF